MRWRSRDIVSTQGFQAGAFGMVEIILLYRHEYGAFAWHDQEVVHRQRALCRACHCLFYSRHAPWRALWRRSTFDQSSGTVGCWGWLEMCEAAEASTAVWYICPMDARPGIAENSGNDERSIPYLAGRAGFGVRSDERCCEAIAVLRGFYCNSFGNLKLFLLCL